MIICCQIGAREHYAIPRSLHQNHQLHSLITDVWVDPNSYFHYLPFTALSKLCDRHHMDLDNAPIKHFTNQAILFELEQKLYQQSNWETIIKRNYWFQKKTIKYLKELNFSPQSKPIIFTYSYAGLEILKYAKKRGCLTILGQIDPGIEEEKIVIQEHQRWQSIYSDPVEIAPANYWENWYQECAIADQIIVNSEWSKLALIKSGIAEHKITIIPLAYESTDNHPNFQRQYPEKFSKDRSLKVLFLGQVILRKGIAHILEAAQQLQSENVEFWIIGKLGITIPETIKALKNIIWLDNIPRSQVNQYYQQADVFLFPTLSDGFGLTQLEAQALKLPIIASKRCGEVVENYKNGLILEEVSAQTIVESIRQLLRNPQQLQDLANHSIRGDRYSLQSIYTQFMNSLENIIK